VGELKRTKISSSSFLINDHMLLPIAPKHGRRERREKEEREEKGREK
jgi:hypothetical protein